MRCRDGSTLPGWVGRGKWLEKAFKLFDTVYYACTWWANSITSVKVFQHIITRIEVCHNNESRNKTILLPSLKDKIAALLKTLTFPYVHNGTDRLQPYYHCRLCTRS